MATFEIPDYNLPKLEEKIAKLNKTAVKLGVPQITVHVSGYQNRLLADLFPNSLLPNGTPRYKDSTACIRFAVVQVQGETPRINGWQFLATIQPLRDEEGKQTGKNMLRVVPGIEGMPDKYREATNYCDHCQTNRMRNETYVVMHELGETKQVGKTCLKDFLGHSNPEKIAEWTTTLANLADLCGSYGPRGPLVDGSQWELRYPTEDFLTYVAAAIRVDGWISRKFSYMSGKPATASVAMEQISLRDDKYTPTSEDRALGEQTALWMEGLELRQDNNDYMKNLATVGSVGCVERRTAGIAASGISAMKREFGESLIPEKKDRPAAANYLGEIGERITVDVTVDVVRAYQNDWSSGFIFKMHTASGDVVTCFNLKGGANEGDKLTIKGTVKKQNEFKGQKETVLNRVVVK